jgi:hypothetical protein
MNAVYSDAVTYAFTLLLSTGSDEAKYIQATAEMKRVRRSSTT